MDDTIVMQPKKSKNIKKYVITAVAVLIVLMLVLSCFTVVSAGHTGVVTTFGRVSENVLQEGAHFKLPWQTVTKMDNRIVKLEVSTEAFSKDLQSVNTTLAINYRVDKTKSYSIYKNVGKDYETVLVSPAVNEVLKAITSRYTAEESVTNREIISDGLVNGLNEKLNDIGIFVEDVNIINFEFSEAYVEAIEQKQVAEQQLLKAETEKKKKIVEAEADAAATKTQAEAQAKANKTINDSLSKNLIEYEKIKKWNGELPKVSGGNTITSFTDSITGDKSDGN